MHPQDLLNFQLVVCLTQTIVHSCCQCITTASQWCKHTKVIFLAAVNSCRIGTVGWCKTLAQIFTESVYPCIYRNSRLKLFVAVKTNFVPFLNKQLICLICVCLFLIQKYVPRSCNSFFKVRYWVFEKWSHKHYIVLIPFLTTGGAFEAVSCRQCCRYRWQSHILETILLTPQKTLKNPSQSTQFKVLKCYHIQATDAKHTRCKLYLKSAKRRVIKTLPNSLKAKWNTCRGSGNNNGLVNWQCERFCQNYRWR